jgi:hypothetical protein
MLMARGLWPKPVYAHRVIHQLHHGTAPTQTDGVEISHLCGNPSCVEVEHLVVESHAANMARIPRGRTGRPVAYDAEAVAARIEADGGEVWGAVVAFGISYGHALRIRRGWRPMKPFVPADEVAS